MKEEDRSFQMRLLSEVLPKAIKSLSCELTYRIALMLGGKDFMNDEEDMESMSAEKIEQSKSFYENLSKGITEEDLEILRESRIDLSKLSIIEGETM